MLLISRSWNEGSYVGLGRKRDTIDAALAGTSKSRRRVQPKRGYCEGLSSIDSPMPSEKARGGLVQADFNVAEQARCGS